jgi:hypothetical protein
MSDETQTSTSIPSRPTIAAALERQRLETEVGIPVKIYLNGEEKPENFLGIVGCFSDPDGFQKKLARLKARKPKSYVFSEAELLPLQREAEIGTFWRYLEEWREEDGSPMASTDENLRKVMSINFVRVACNAVVTAEESWQSEQREALRKN